MPKPDVDGDKPKTPGRDDSQQKKSVLKAGGDGDRKSKKRDDEGLRQAAGSGGGGKRVSLDSAGADGTKPKRSTAGFVDDDMMENDGEEDGLDFSTLRNFCRSIVKIICKHWKKTRQVVGAFVAKEVEQAWGKTKTAHMLGDLKRTSRSQIRRDMRSWFRRIFGAGKAKISKKFAEIGQDGDAGFGVKCFIIHNPGDINDFFDVDPDELGAGGSAKVFKARERATHVKRAVKKIYKRNPAEFKRLMQEVTIMKDLDHPNITRLYETFEDEKHLYLVLELCEGGDVLDRLLENSKETEFHTAVIIRTVLMVLNYLHSNGYVHRDIKPENILFKEERSDVVCSALRIVDFGFSTKLDEDNQVMTTKVGSPYFIAPEVLEGDYDKRCDVWSVGVVAYLLLCGYPPFCGNTDAQTLNLVRQGKYLFHKQQWRLVSKPAKHLIRHLLLVDPRGRLTLTKALAHPWIRGRGVVKIERMRDETVDRLITFHQYHRLRRSAMLAVAYQLEVSDVRELQELFQGLDLNGDGLLTRTEFMKAVQACGIEDSYIVAMMHSVDADNSGVIDFCEFLAATLEKSLYINNHAALLRAFRSFDQDDSGVLTATEIAETLRVDPKTGMDEVNNFFKEVDLNGDGMMDYGEFHALLQREIDPERTVFQEDEEKHNDEDEEESGSEASYSSVDDDDYESEGGSQQGGDANKSSDRKSRKSRKPDASPKSRATVGQAPDEEGSARKKGGSPKGDQSARSGGQSARKGDQSARSGGQSALKKDKSATGSDDEEEEEEAGEEEEEEAQEEEEEEGSEEESSDGEERPAFGRANAKPK